jgi:hypothetical protein
MEWVLLQVARARKPSPQGDLFGEARWNRLPANTARALLRRGLIESVPQDQKQLALAHVTPPHEPIQYVRLTDNGRRRLSLMRLGHCHPYKETKP